MSEFHIKHGELATVPTKILGNPLKKSRNTSLRGVEKEAKMLQQLTVDTNDTKGDELKAEKMIC